MKGSIILSIRRSFFGYCGDRAKGLVFCRNKEEAYELSHKFNQRGYKTLALCGSDDQNKREEAIERLVSDERNDYLEYIFTIDIFNEGVDIPEINQVIMLRPTQSIVVFVQQLGRGLRKAKHKDYVVIIDFIGNYKNNFMIPMALSGDRTYNKDTIRRYLQEGNKVIPGSSTIHFDEISRKRIYEAIDEANFSDISLIKDSYTQLRQKLGHIPSLKEFDEHGSIDPLLIFTSKTLGSYHELLKRYEKEYSITFDGGKENVLKFVSKKFANGKRPHELLALNYLLDHDENVFDYLEKELESKYEIKLDIKARENLINILTNEFLSKGEKKTFADCVFIQKDQDDYRIAKNFKEMLKDEDFKKQLKETLNFGLYRNKSEYHERYDGTSFSLYAKYTYEEVCRLLNWSKNEVPLNIGGYKYDKGTNTYPIFINYDKDSDISDTQKYEDHLLSPDQLVAISKSGRTVSSDDVSKALNSKKLGIEMDLFIRKNKDDKGSKEFYYMGKIYPTGVYKEFVMPNTNKTAVEINYMLKTPIKDDLYDYIING